MEFVKTTIKGSIATIVLDRGKVNAINHSVVKEIRQTFHQLELDDEIRGVIITGKPHYFSAGLDVIELYDYDYDQIKAFWLDFLGMMIDLTKFVKPVIAAISGHSPAGGAIIAITADWRLMATGEKYLIGLNEVAVGINITTSIFDLYSFWLGKRQAYHALLSGQLFNVQQAEQIGLIDEVVELDKLLEVAENKLNSILRANDHILQTTKKMLRAGLIKEIDIDLTEQVKERCDYWMSAQSRNQLGALVQRLTQGK